MQTVSLPVGPILAFDDVGEGAPAIVFSHGLFMDRDMFAPQVERLAHRHRCVSWDARGHGDTVSRGPFTYWQSARDLLQLMDALDLDRVVHVGMSQGGLMAQRAALLAPDRFSGIVLLDTQAGTLVGDGAPRFEALADEWAVHGPDDETIDWLADLILGDGVDADPWKAKWRALERTRPRDFVRALIEREDMHERLPEIRTPVLVVHGTADASTPVERARALADGVADCRGLVLVDGAPHAANLSHPDDVTKAIGAFADEVTR
ncbi:MULTISPECIES: alpha/beta hydrolase [unclassified Pseudonocardia]|uniref:alpha/beta fold hydrolase n=1 Tax=unclassified Pseudonocardia TaxID=2619320 RepID=UPI0009623C05|nr:alpha/beta hydrolase [Pseudonocardia sp. Ae707_Ps1]OLM08950.1 alpha/beta hydrolase fold [Pseudonocardia sp. Ae707_Ps1]